MPSQEVIDSRAQQIAALESARDQATPWPGPGPKPINYLDKADIWGFIDQLKEFWAMQDEAAKPKPPAPPIVPAPSDAWRNLPVGTPVTIDGVNYVVRSLMGGTTMLCKVKAPPPAPPAVTVVSFKADCLKWVTDACLKEDSEEAQAILIRFLDWLAAK